MGWLRLTFELSRRRAAAAEALLEELGALSVTYLPAQEVPPQEVAPHEQRPQQSIVEPAVGATPLWQRCELQALFDLDVDFRRVRQRLQRAQLQQTNLKVDFLDDADWLNRWRQHAVEFQFGGRLWIAPRDSEVSGELVLRLNPGLAFGTGSHPTTRLCLDWLACAELAKRRLLDFGCGSGILALAARLLGCAVVYAVDHDPQALLATQENAAYNRLADAQLIIGTQDVAAKVVADVAPFDVVVANILANPLIELAEEIADMLAPGGKLVLSGILHSQMAEVQAAYPNMDFELPALQADEQGAQWVRLVATKAAAD